MADESRRIDIGFQGGPVLPTRVKQSSYDELHKALSKDRSDRNHVRWRFANAPVRSASAVIAASWVASPSMTDHASR